MFGYTVPMYSRLTPSNLSTYRRYYCETCHQLRSGFGLVSTLAVNYDMTFNTIILNSIAGDVLDFKGTENSPFCVLKAPGADSDLMKRMAAYTILLTKWELVDDSVDGPSLKSKLASLSLERAISKAEKDYPEYDEKVGKGFDELRAMEISGCTDAVLMGRRFGRSLSFALQDIAGEHADSDMEEFFTSLCSMIYIMDAVDDLDQDFMEGTHNPFLASCEGYVNKGKYVSENIYALTETMNRVNGDMQSSYSSIRERMRTAEGLCDNIVYYGIPDSARRALNGTNEAKASLKNAFKGRRERNASY